MARRTQTILKQLLNRHPPPLFITSRSVTYMPLPGDGAPRTVTLIPGDDIRPLVTGAVEQVMKAMHAPIYFEKSYGDKRRRKNEKSFGESIVQTKKKGR